MKKLKIRVSDLAQERLLDILNYIEIEWSLKSRNKFLEKFDEKVNQICLHPKSCQESEENPGLHKGVVEKHVSFFYRVSDEYIDLLYVYDNREDPERIREIIS